MAGTAPAVRRGTFKVGELTRDPLKAEAKDSEAPAAVSGEQARPIVVLSVATGTEVITTGRTSAIVPAPIGPNGASHGQVPATVLKPTDGVVTTDGKPVLPIISRNAVGEQALPGDR